MYISTPCNEPFLWIQSWEGWDAWWNPFRASGEVFQGMEWRCTGLAAPETNPVSYVPLPLKTATCPWGVALPALSSVSPDPPSVCWPVCEPTLCPLASSSSLLWAQARGPVAGQFRIPEPALGPHVLGPPLKRWSPEPLRELLNCPLPQFPLW